jgi:hypothetical protein
MSELVIRYGPEILNSAALRVLPGPATKFLHAFEAELVNGAYNGKLHVPQRVIMEWARIKRKGDISLPVLQCHRLGFIRATAPGLVRLTYFPVGSTPPTNEWRLIKTIEEAEAILATLKGGNTSRPQTDEFKHRIETGEWPKRR